jgi:hypothetical protein
MKLGHNRDVVEHWENNCPFKKQPQKDEQVLDTYAEKLISRFQTVHKEFLIINAKQLLNEYASTQFQEGRRQMRQEVIEIIKSRRMKYSAQKFDVSLGTAEYYRLNSRYNESDEILNELEKLLK